MSKSPKRRSSSRDRGRSSRSPRKRSYSRSPKRRGEMYKDSTTLYIGNLSYNVRERELRKYMEDYGNVRAVTIGLNKKTSQSKGYAFVEFFDRKDAEDCYDKFQGYNLDGRRVRIDWDIGLDAKMTSGSSKPRYPRRYRSRSRDRDRRRSRSPRRSPRRSPKRSRSRDRKRSRTPKKRRSRSNKRSGTRSPKRRSPTPKKSRSKTPEKEEIKNGDLS